MRIAMLVHNDVVSDARVQKEALSLSEAGHHVEIHGISEVDSVPELKLSNANVSIFLSRPSAHGWLNQLFGKTAARRIPRYVGISAKACLRVPVALGIAVIISAPLTLFAFIISFLFDFIGHANTFFGSLVLVTSLYIFAPRRTVRIILHGLAQAQKSLTQIVKRLHNLRIYDPAYVVRKALVQQIYSNKSAESIILQRYRTLSKSLKDSVATRPVPDVVHIHDHIALLAAPDIKKIYGCPLVWDAHEIYESLGVNQPGRSHANARIIESAQEHIDYFITINDSIANFYKSHYSNLGESVILMNASLATAKPSYDGRLHSAAGLPTTQKILLFQGGFAPARGLRQLVESAALLRPDWSLVMMGWGNLEDELRELATETARLGPCPHVIFLPGVPQHELLHWTAGASLGAIPYEDTGLNHLYCTPNKLWEYPSAGVPILCTDLVEMSRLVTANGIGFLLPRAFSATDIAFIVNNLADETLADARLKCRQFTEANNWDVYADRLLDLYARIEMDTRSDTGRKAQSLN